MKLQIFTHEILAEKITEKVARCENYLNSPRQTLDHYLILLIEITTKDLTYANEHGMLCDETMWNEIPPHACISGQYYLRFLTGLKFFIEKKIDGYVLGKFLAKDVPYSCDNVAMNIYFEFPILDKFLTDIL